MHIIIAGGTGFIGTAMTRFWLHQGHDITLLTRSKRQAILPRSVRLLTWDEFNRDPESILSHSQILLNLCGANIGDKRWTAARKKELLNSRLIPTHQCAIACSHLGKDGPRLINANAMGIYGPALNGYIGLPKPCDEFTSLPNPPNTFSSDLCQQWQAALQPAEIANVTVITLRFAPILDPSGGILAKLLPMSRWGLGSIIGSGSQVMSWVTLEDTVAAIDFLATQTGATGPYNIVAPRAVTQAEFAESLSKAVHSHARLRLPEIAVRWLFGQMGKELLLEGQHVIPSRLLELGFEFKDPQLEPALKKMLG